jgi:alpha-1,2-mannosyltransferase
VSTTLDARADATAPAARRGFADWRHFYRWPAVLIVATLAGAGVTVLWLADVYRLAPQGFMDLDAYRLGVQAWLHGQNMYGTLPRTDFGNELPFIYPPFAAAVFVPLAELPWHAMIVAMMALSTVCLAVVGYLTARRVWPGGGARGAVLVTALMVPLSLTAEPVWDTFYFGQINLLLMLLVALDCLVDRPKWPRGLLIGIAAAIKLTPAVFLLFFLLRKDYRTSTTIVVSAAAASLIGFVASWSGSWLYWFGASGGARSISGTGFIGNQSIDGGLARWGLSKHDQNTWWLLLVAVALVFAVIGIVRAHRMSNAPLAMVVTACFGLVASPVSWGHHWVYAIPAIVVMLAVGIQRRHVGWLLAAVATAVVLAVVPFFYVADGGTVMTVTQQLKTNAYTVLGLVLLVAFALPPILRRARGLLAYRAASVAEAVPEARPEPTPESESAPVADPV